jgi:hypothetical protein
LPVVAAALPVVVVVVVLVVCLGIITPYVYGRCGMRRQQCYFSGPHCVLPVPKRHKCLAQTALIAGTLNGCAGAPTCEKKELLVTILS